MSGAYKSNKGFQGGTVLLRVIPGLINKLPKFVKMVKTCNRPNTNREKSYIVKRGLTASTAASKGPLNKTFPQCPRIKISVMISSI